MSIDLWQAAAAAAVAGAVGAAFSRWWCGRDVKTLARELAKLESQVQAGAKVLARSRKQTDDLQRLVAEYRRRLNANEVNRRRLAEARPAFEEPTPPKVEPDTHVALPKVPSAGWADTQPFESS